MQETQEDVLEKSKKGEILSNKIIDFSWQLIQAADGFAPADVPIIMTMAVKNLIFSLREEAQEEEKNLMEKLANACVRTLIGSLQLNNFIIDENMILGPDFKVCTITPPGMGNA